MKISIVKKTNSQHPLYTDVVKNKKNKSPLDQEIDRQLKVQSIASSPSLEYNEHPHIFASSFKEQKSTNQLRRNYGKLSKSFLQKEKVNWDLQKVHEKNLRLALLGLAQGSYTFDRYRKKETKKFAELLISGSKSSDKKWIEETKVLNESIHLCRDLINTPAEDMGPDQFEKATRSAIRGTGLKLKVLRQKDCEKEKMGALLAVGKASHRETRMLVLEWPGSKKTTAKNKKFHPTDYACAFSKASCLAAK